MVNANVAALWLVASSFVRALGYEVELPSVNVSLRGTPLVTMGMDPPYGPRGLYLKRVLPVIGSTVFDVTSSKYGAVGDKHTDDTKAIQNALIDCAKSHDGGVVLLPNKDGSVYVSYPLVMQGRGCALVIAPGATLFAKPWLGKEPPCCWPTHFKGAFVTMDDCTSCAIGGGGTIDGNGPYWWHLKAGWTWQNLINVKNSRDVALWNFTATDGALHTIELFADDVEVAHMRIVMNWTAAQPKLHGGLAPNTDGIDVHGEPTYVHHTLIDVGDDNIAVHASNVVVEDSHFGGPAMGHGEVHGHGASIGSMDSHNKVQNVTFRRMIFENVQVGPKIKVRSSATDGYVKDVTYQDMIIYNTQDRDFHIFTNDGMDSDDDMGERQLAAFSSRRRKGSYGADFFIDNVKFINVTATGTRKRKGTSGLDCSDKIKCTNIQMIDVHLNSPGSGPVHCNSATGTQKNVSPPTSCFHSGDASIIV